MSSQKEAIAGLDIGGTGMKGAPVTKDGNFVIDSPFEAPANSNREATIILRGITDLIARTTHESAIKGYRLTTCGIGFPGPTNYEAGIPLMRHKFQSLYGFNIKDHLEQAISIPIDFLNDADAFGLGVSWKEYPDEERLLVVTLGTGLGASYIIEGKIATKNNRGADRYEVAFEEYKGKILEEWTARNFIETDYLRLSGSNEPVEVKDIADFARAGQEAAINSFKNLAENLGEGLAINSTQFQPTRVVFGGKISNAFDLFGTSAEEIFAQKIGKKVPFSSTKNEYGAILGAAHFADKK